MTLSVLAIWLKLSRIVSQLEVLEVEKEDRGTITTG